MLAIATQRHKPSCCRRIPASGTPREASAGRSAAASSNTCAGLRGVSWRGLGTNASNPLARGIPDPAVQGLPGDAHLPPERVGVFTRSQLAHHLPVHLGRVRRIGGFADQLIPEQSDRSGPSTRTDYCASKREQAALPQLRTSGLNRRPRSLIPTHPSPTAATNARRSRRHRVGELFSLKYLPVPMLQAACH
jgi:hypothetical protein